MKKPKTQEQFAVLVEQYQGMLKSYIRTLTSNSATAEDIIQDVWLTLYNSRDTLNWSNFTFGLLKTIAYRRYADHFRKPCNWEIGLGLTLGTGNGTANVEHTGVSAGELMMDKSHMPTPDHILSEEIGVAVSSLPSHMQPCVRDVLMDDYTHKEAAQRHGLSIGTVLSRISRARVILRELLKDDYATL